MAEDAVEDALRPQAMGIVRAAVAAAGNAGDMTEWKDRVYSLIGAIGTMMTPQPNPDALEMALWSLQSTSFNGTFVKAERDTNTKRLMVHFKSPTADDGGMDVVRTEPDWTPLGAAMQRRVLNELRPGDECKVFKHIEQVDAKRKVRMLVHFDILRRAGKGEVSPPGAPQSAPAPNPPVVEPEQAPSSPRAASSPPEGATLADSGPTTPEIQQSNRAALDAAQAAEDDQPEMHAVEQAMYGASRLEEVKISAQCRSKGITSWAMPTAEQLPVVLEIIKAVRESK